MTDLTEIKATQRRAAFAARKAAHASGAEATDPLSQAVRAAPSRIVAGYMPIRTEIDPIAAMTVLHAEGRRICVPVIEGAGQPLAFREWTPDAMLVPGPFGAQVPEGGDWLTPDTLIVPLVAFDRAGNRLGYGGGFYDRTLERLRAHAPTHAIGLAYAAQEMPLTTEPTDQPLDRIVTEAGIIDPLAAPVAAR
ncbi:5-formyltetrahydrofolate cyclo-ligase [Roseobacter sp. HKCCA0434]|uniref:5-formyltetrahydrofolate cyclo-ligase n=1 Tax=Roseobacter sp. HKCCA0434 TaxID=3079297 RepID=UPI002905E60E|nr:5-formyltetrahydrofolate cyclo-ligase [Roseobacter sp. HKCCA0434]